MSDRKLLLLLFITCHCVLRAGGFIYSNGRTPAPVHESCTRELVSSLSCDFEGDMCSYKSVPDSRGGMWFHPTGPITSRHDSRKYLTMSKGRHKAPTGSNAWLRALVNDSTVEAVCIEYRYRAVGYPMLRLYNELANGTRHQFGSIVDNTYPKWKLARFHTCVAENSFITFRATNRADYTAMDLDSIRVTKSTKDCTSYRNENAIYTTVKTTEATTANVTANPRRPDNTTGSKQTCTTNKIGQLSCDFQKDLCGYSSMSTGNGNLEWRRDFFRTKGIYARLYDPTLNAPVGAGARLRGAIPGSNTTSVCIEFAYWGERNATIAVYNEKANETDRLIGQIITDNPDHRKLARFSSCISKNSFISIEATKISNNSLWVWIDDLKVLESNVDCVESSSPTFIKHSPSI